MSWRREGLLQGLLGAWLKLEGAAGSREQSASRRSPFQPFLTRIQVLVVVIVAVCAQGWVQKAVTLATLGLFWGFGGGWGALAQLPPSSQGD